MPSHVGAVPVAAQDAKDHEEELVNRTTKPKSAGLPPDTSKDRQTAAKDEEEEQRRKKKKEETIFGDPPEAVSEDREVTWVSS